MASMSLAIEGFLCEITKKYLIETKFIHFYKINHMYNEYYLTNNPEEKKEIIDYWLNTKQYDLYILFKIILNNFEEETKIINKIRNM